jgi:polyhydroxyalkanoate synthase
MADVPASRSPPAAAADARSPLAPVPVATPPQAADGAAPQAPTPPGAATPSPQVQDLDSAFRAAIGKATGGLSPLPFAAAWFDWALQLGASPGRQAELAQEALRRCLDTMTFAQAAATGNAPAGGETAVDPRFAGEAWQQFPYNVMARAYQHQSDWLGSLTENLSGLKPRHAELVSFTVQQWLEALSPANFLATNPELIELTRREGGANLKRGLEHYLEDMQRTLAGAGPKAAESFVLGENLAATPGKVVFRNELIELLQYSPMTPEVFAEPVLIVPAWIMKYYVLDLSARNSLVRYLVAQGHSVFMVSWKNPEGSDGDFAMDDYLDRGLLAALEAVGQIVPERHVHAVGYCIGGTLLAIGAALLARENDARLASMTLLAAQTDFSEPGELSLFISPDQLALLEAQMKQEGVMEARQMGAAFQMLRPRDLIWQPMVRTYLKGEREPMVDLMAWNADGTRMPWRMHTEYLYRLYLDNELATGRFPVHGEVVRLSDVRLPMFTVGTETDHVAPWKSVYKVENLVRSDDYTFLLTSGGHNAGIVSGPVHPKRRHRVTTRKLADRHASPDEWLAATPAQPGSWWPVWQSWLAAHSSGRIAPPRLGAPEAGYAVLADAPGDYVRMK